MKQIKTYINEKLRLTTKYSYQPESKYELQEIILQHIKDEGNECDLNDIDVSKITDMSWLFDATENLIFLNFNGDISQWDVSKVEDMQYMFNCCKKFNCDLSRWDVSNVKDIRHMFYYCKTFNQDLDSWDVSNVENMKYAFKDCSTTPKWYDRKQNEIYI